MDGVDGNNSTGDIYINFKAVSDERGKETADSTKTRSKSPESTVKEPARNRNHRSVVVCLVVLCVLLLTAVIVLCVLNYTNNHQFNNIKNITEERDQLLTKYTNITEERDQLLTEKINLTEEREELRVNYNNISEQCEQLKQEKKKLLGLLQEGWIYYEVNLYLISSEKKSWSESRKYCQNKGADLVIINNKQEQDFVKNITNGEGIWIGLSDSDEEGRWKWVDGSTLNYRFWRNREPGGQRTENCAGSTSGWDDYSCTLNFKSICEKNIF